MPPHRPAYAFDTDGHTVVTPRKESKSINLITKLAISGIFGSLIMAILLIGTFWCFGTPITADGFPKLMGVCIIAGIFSVLVKVAP